MTYEEIIQLENLSDRQTEFKNFYENDVKVLEWMYDEEKYQHVVFNDREEFKYNNKYHSINGPAIKHTNGTEYYYIFGELMTKEKWKPIATRMLREKKLKRTLKNDQ